MLFFGMTLAGEHKYDNELVSRVISSHLLENESLIVHTMSLLKYILSCFMFVLVRLCVRAVDLAILLVNI